MKAIQLPTPGGPDAMVLVETPTPTPVRGQALVRVEAAGVNFIDVYQRTGFYKMEPPVRLGLEGAGVVEAVGPEVDGVRVGDRVAWCSVAGSYATHVVAPVEKLVSVPGALDSRRAAAAMLQGLTAHYLVKSTFPLGAGDSCLVHAAAGGVGLLLCQLAKRAGARVFATVSTEEKAARAREAGADDVLSYDDFAAEVARRTQGRGVAVVYDSVGRSTFDQSLACLRPRGMLVSFGQSSGAIGAFDPLVLSAGGSLFFTRPTLGHYTATRMELVARAHEIFELIAQGALRISIHATFPLSASAEAHRQLEGRRTTGKVLLDPTA